jgi:hypothetical protein
VHSTAKSSKPSLEFALHEDKQLSVFKKLNLLLLFSGCQMFNLFARAECTCNDSLGNCQGKPNGVGQHLAKHQQFFY